MEILEHEHEHGLLGERLEEGSPGGERFVLAIAARFGVATNAGERTQVAEHPLKVVPCALRRLDQHAELLVDRLRLVPLEDAGPLLDDLAERPKVTPSP